jgi:serine/threonine protein kinase
MAATAFASCAEYVSALTDNDLVGPEDGLKVAEFLRSSPPRRPSELVHYLVQQEMLTPFQADYVVEGRAADLKLFSYSLIDVIGKGAMGTVFKARSAKDRGVYAVKVVPSRNVLNLKTVTEKIRALQQVRHPQVSALVTIGRCGERVYLVWPYLVGGQKLDDVLRKHGKLPVRNVVQLALQLATCLQPYHEHGLFHGLLKPSDVLIGTNGRVRVLDFGVGFVLTTERGKAILDTMTNSKAMAKGLDCASPESILDSLSRSPAGDQYSLGCILYRCLTGSYPFPSDNPVKKMVAHQSEIPTPVRKLSPETPPALAAVVERLMEKAPEDRYESMGEVVDALQRIASPVPIRDEAAAEEQTAEVSEEEESDDEVQQAGPRSLLTVRTVLTGLAAGLAAGLLTWWLMRI